MTHIKLKTPISNWKAILFYCLVSLFLFFEMAVQVSPSVMSSQLMHDLHVSAFGLGIMSGVYFYSYTAMQIPSGLLFDRYNPRIIILLSILTCAAGTLLFAVSTNIYLGSLARLLMGSGSAFAFVSVLVVTADLFKSKYFALMTGITQMLAALGAMTGQMPISLLVETMGWRHTLFILFALGILLAIVVWKLLNYEKAITPKTVDSQLYQTIKSDLKKITTHSQSWFIALYACLLWAPMSTFASLWGVPFLTTVDNIDQTTAALLCSMMWLGLALASPILGLLATAFNNKIYPLAFSALLGAVAFGLVLEVSLSPILIGVMLFLAGAACSGQALSFTLVKENNYSSVTGTAIAFNNMAVVISGALFQPLIGKLIETTPQSHFYYQASTFKNGLMIVLIAYVISFLIALLLIKEPSIASKETGNLSLKQHG